MNLEEHTSRRQRRDKGNLQITNRDAITLAWIAQQYCISFDHLQRLLGRYAKAETKTPGILSVSATRDTIARWLQLELVEQPRKLLAEHPPYLWLSRHGLTQLALPYAHYHPRPSMVPHIYAVNGLRLLLESYGLRSRWFSHRTLTRSTNERPQPDAELHSLDALPLIALKVLEKPALLDITIQEELLTLQTLLTRRNAHNGTTNAPRYANLWYFLHDDTLSLFEQHISQLDPASQQRITLYGLDATPNGQQRPASSRSAHSHRPHSSAKGQANRRRAASDPAKAGRP